jgi:hypothetical protein
MIYEERALTEAYFPQALLFSERNAALPEESGRQHLDSQRAPIRQACMMGTAVGRIVVQHSF